MASSDVTALTRTRTRPEPLLTGPFLLAAAAQLVHGLALHAYVHLPGYLKDLRATELQIGFVFGVTAAIAIIARPWVGRLMDSRGRRLVIIGGGVVHLAACLAYPFVTEMGPYVYAVRAVHGVAEAALFSSLFTYATDIIPASRRTEGIAIFGVSGLLPIALGGLVGDFVLAHGSYRALFGLTVVLALGALLLSLPLREPPRDESVEPPRGFFAAVFQRDLLPIWFLGTCFSTSLSSFFVFLKTYVIETGVGSVGGFLGAYALTAIALRLFFGWVPDRFGPKRVLYPAVAMVAVGLFMLARATTAAEVVIAGALGGLGHGFSFPIVMGLVVSRARESERGSAVSVFTALFDLGMLIGGPLFGAVIAAAGYGAMFTVAASGILLGGVGFALWDRARA